MEKEDILAKDTFSQTVIHKAALQNHVDILQFLKQQGKVQLLDFGIADHYFKTPLMMACLCGHLETVQFLLDFLPLCDLNRADHEYATPLSFAAFSGNVQILNLLIETMGQTRFLSDVQKGRAGLVQAAKMGHVPTLRVFLDLLDDPWLWLRQDKTGTTALATAAMSEKWTCVQILLDHIPDHLFEAVDVRADTGLVSALATGPVAVVQSLVDKIPKSFWTMTMEPEAGTSSILVMAAKHGHVGLVQIFTELLPGHVLMAQDGLGQIALNEAAWHGHLDIVQILVDAIPKEDVHKKDAEFKTAVEHAMDKLLNDTDENKYMQILRVLSKD